MIPKLSKSFVQTISREVNAIQNSFPVGNDYPIRTYSVDRKDFAFTSLSVLHQHLTDNFFGRTCCLKSAHPISQLLLIGRSIHDAGDELLDIS